MKKIVAMVIITLLVMTSFAALPCISATITGHKSNEIVASDKDEAYSTTCLTRGNPPLPPVMWTEDFSTFYISTPQDPDGDHIYYLIDWGDGTSSGWIGPYEPGETVCISHVWSDEGTYQIKAKAKDQDGESKCAVYSLTLLSDFKFFGVEIGYVDITYTFTIYWKDCEYFIFIDWGDGTSSGWLGPYIEPVLFSHAWSSPGEYVLRLKMKDIYGNESDWLTLTITILPLENDAPNKPIIDGPLCGKVGVPYDYTFVTTDPNGDDVYYWIEWGDGNVEEWIGPYASGEEVIVSHTWSKKGTYTIKARAKDVHGAVGDWGTPGIIMIPVNQPSSQQSSNPLFFQILQRLMNIR